MAELLVIAVGCYCFCHQIDKSLDFLEPQTLLNFNTRFGAHGGF